MMLIDFNNPYIMTHPASASNEIDLITDHARSMMFSLIFVCSRGRG